MANIEFKCIKNKLSAPIVIGAIALLLGLGRLNAADVANESSQNNTGLIGQANSQQGHPISLSQIKELAGKVLIDAQLEGTQAIQADKYINFVTVSTPTLTPAAGHTLLFANSAANQFIAKYHDGTTQVLGSGGGSSGTSWGSITGTLSAQTDLQTALNSIGAATATIRTDFNTSTATLTSSITSLGAATGTIRTDFNTSTNSINTSLIAVGVATASIRSDFNTSTATLSANFPVSLSTNVTGSLPDSRLSANVPLLNSTQTWTGAETFNSSVTINKAMLDGTATAGTSGQLWTSNGNNTSPTWQSAGATTGRVVQSSQCVVTTSSSTTSGTYVQTNILCTITPTSASNKVRVSAQCEAQISISGAGTTTFTLLRNNTNLFASNGFTAFQPNFTGTSERFPISMSTYLDSPASTSSQRYAIGFANNSGATVNINDLTGTCWMLLEETN